MKKEKNLDLTQGPILRTLTELALPIMASSFLSTAYNITDMAWIGMLGAKAVAGVGVGGMYVWLSQGLVSLARMGGQVNMAQCCGQKKTKEAGCYATASLQMTIFFAVIFSAICLIFTDPLVAFYRLNDAQTVWDATIYMKITCGLILFPYLNNTLTGLFTAQGDSQTPFKANLIGLVTNMILDPLLILGPGPCPKIGVSGAAIATVFSQILVFLVLFLSLKGSANNQNILKKLPVFTPVASSYYHSVLQIGLPTALQGTLYCMISMVLTRMVASFGPAAIATQRVGGQIESVSWNTAEGFGSALNAFVAQNFGAKKHDRIRKGYRISFLVLGVWGLLVTAAFVFLPEPISRLFFHEEEVIKIAVEYMIILGIGELFMCEELMTIGALSGLGKTKICSIISIICTGARIPLAMLLIHLGMGLAGVWWALTISSIVKGFVFYYTFQRVSRRLN